MIRMTTKNHIYKMKQFLTKHITNFLVLCLIMLCIHLNSKSSLIEQGWNECTTFVNDGFVILTKEITQEIDINKLLRLENEKLRKRLTSLLPSTTVVKVTMYHPVSNQTDSTPNITADGTIIKVNNASDYRYVAVSRNMLVNYGGFLAYGDYVFVDAGIKSGVYQVRDTMARRWMNRIDILETPGVKPYKYKEASIRRITMASADVNDRSFETY